MQPKKQANKKPFKKANKSKPAYKNGKAHKQSKPAITAEQVLTFQNKTYQLHRYPATTDQSLRAWSNAELLAVDYLLEKQIKVNNIHLFNDRFGVWNTLLNQQETTSVFTYASQAKAVEQNLKRNKLDTAINAHTPLDDLQNVELALIKVPKSLALFELFLQQIHKTANTNTQVVCAFMTKYFASSLLKIASVYFEEVEQSQSWKKARLLILKKPKTISQYKPLMNHIEFNGTDYQQYFGVFSAEKIDIGTQFLLEQFSNGNLMVKAKETQILDLACGNGVIAKELSKHNANATFTLTDDLNLAVESARLNLQGVDAHFVCDDNLDSLADEKFDLVVSNPPFHFEHENNIEVSLALFAEVRRVLKTGGRFVLVANKHLSYDTHLTQIFKEVHIIAISNNKKFVAYECR